MIIGIISDTHGLLREEVVNSLKGCDLIIHAGDIGKLELIDKLKNISNVEVVKGNCDKDIEHQFISEHKIINIKNKKIYLIHDIGKINMDLEKIGIDILIYGHSHKSKIFKENGVIYINPGSVGPRRFKLPISMCKLYIEEDININLDENIIEFGDIKIQPIEIV